MYMDISGMVKEISDDLVNDKLRDYFLQLMFDQFFGPVVYKIFSNLLHPRVEIISVHLHLFFEATQEPPQLVVLHLTFLPLQNQLIVEVHSGILGRPQNQGRFYLQASFVHHPKCTFLTIWTNFIRMVV